MLNDYIFKKTNALINGITNVNGVTFDFGYANGYFFVNVNYPQGAPNVKFPPLLVFNNFPSADDFSNLLLDHTNRHL